MLKVVRAKKNQLRGKNDQKKGSFLDIPSKYYQLQLTSILTVRTSSSKSYLVFWNLLSILFVYLVAFGNIM